MDESGIEATQALDFVDDGDETDEDIDPNAPVAYLSVRCQKGFLGNLFPIVEGDNVIGRHEGCQVTIPLKALSREHACIEVKGGSHFIYDKGSRNRTKRNKHFLAAAVRYELKDKDKLTFGDVECEYQLQKEMNDDGSDTESESMFQTAPADDDVSENYASDASSNILEPTQPFAKNTQSMLETKSMMGETSIAQDITVKDTPAPSRTKKFTDNIVIPESGTDTEDEGETYKETSADRSRLLVAETQAYVCESDDNSDIDDNVGNKSSLLMAPTQAFVQNIDEDDNVSTCSETSPRKKQLMMAATQAFVDESDDDDDVSPKKKQMIDKTQVYDMDEGIEPTQGYDMDAEEDSEKETEDEDKKVPGILFEPAKAFVKNDEETKGDECKKVSGILFEPTQAYVKNEEETKGQDDGNMSESSEEFVLEGDTDAEEDDEDTSNILAAPTLACDESDIIVGETQPAESTQVLDEKVEENDGTVAVCDDPTQVFDDIGSKKSGAKARKSVAKEVLDNEAKTQVLNDATQVFDDVDSKEEGKKTITRKAMKKMDIDTETLVFDDATQVFEDKNKDCKTSKETLHADTQVFDDATLNIETVSSDNRVSKSTPVSQTGDTQVIDSEIETDTNVRTKTDAASGDPNLETQVIEDVSDIVQKNNENNAEAKKDEGKTSQGFDKHADTTQTVNEETGNTFDFLGTSTLAVDNIDSEESVVTSNKQPSNTDNDLATQVFTDTDETCMVTDDQAETDTGNVKQKESPCKKTDDVEAVTQVFDEADATVAVDDEGRSDLGKEVKSPNRSELINQPEKQNIAETVPITEGEEHTQVFDETVAVEETSDVVKLTKRGKKGQKKTPQNKATTSATGVPTQVIDETVPVHEMAEDVTETKESKKKFNKSTELKTESDEPTQVFDETVAVEEIPEIRKPTKGKGRKGLKKNDKTNIEQSECEAPMQIFDEIVTVRSNEPDEPGCDNVTDRKGEIQNVKEDNTTKHDDLDKSACEAGEILSKRKSGRKKQTCKENTKDAENVVETNKNTRTSRSRTRGSKTLKDNDDTIETTSAKTDVPNKNVIVRKSGRNSLKAESTDTNEEQSGTVRKSGRSKKNVNKRDIVDDKSLVEGNNEEQKDDNKKEVKDTEAATQIYDDNDTSDTAAATQRYGEDNEDEDLTPDIETVLAQEANRVDTPVIKTVIPAKSPLKSALASPKKDRTPSPKKVQFVSQKSETESESSETTRRSKRSNKGRASVRLEDAEDYKQISNSKDKKKVVLVKSEVNEENEEKGKSNKKGKRGVRTLEPPKNEEVINDSVEKMTENVPVTLRRQGKAKNSIDQVKEEAEDSVKVKKNEMKPESVIENTCKVTRKGGRKSTSTNVPDRKVSVRATRTSLPAVLENKISDNIIDTDKTIKSNKKASKRKIDEASTSEDKESVSNGVKNKPTTKRQSVEVNTESTKTDITADKKVDNNDLKPSRRVTRHKELNELVDDKSENTKTDVKNTRVKTVENESQSCTTQVDEMNQDVKTVTRKGKKGHAVSNSRSENGSQNELMQEKGSGNKRSSRRNAGGDSVIDKTVDNMDVKKTEEVAETKRSSGRLKRKESASSSNDSQESELGDTPAKRQRRGKAPVMSTPVSSTKQKSVKKLDESVSNSPTLRRTTIEGTKAKVMFTGVVDEQGQKIVKELGGELVNSVMDCTHLVTDQVRRTVKFLCCLSRGVPIVVPQWLISSKTSGFFVDSAPFLVTDETSERKFKFRLDHSLDKASKDPMFDGFTFHVTKSVRPEPAQMKDILQCAGAKYCDKMPVSNTSGNTVVVSCIEDKTKCVPAVKAGIPIMSAEFVLTGILRQEVDIVSFKLDFDEPGNKRSQSESSTEPSKKRRR